MVANDVATETVGLPLHDGSHSELPDAAEINRLVHEHLDLVEIIASQVSSSIDNCIDFDELLAAGREGLFDAARRFDAKRGASFRTFANYRIEGAIIDTVRRSLNLSRKAEQQLKALEATGRVSEGDYSPGMRDTATWRERKGPEDFIHDEVVAMATAAAMSMAQSGGGTSGISSADPEEAYERAELMALVRSAMEDLDSYESQTVRLCCFEDMSSNEAAKAMAISKPWAHRLYTRGMMKLAKRLRHAGYG